MLHGEISIYPMGTGSTSASFYIAKAIEVLKKTKIKHEVTAMGTLLESENIDEIFDASKKMLEAVHNLGVSRVECILKLDSRKDKQAKLEDKIESLKKHLTD